MAKQEIIWIPEDQAAAMLNYKPKVFRRYVREGKLPGIDFTKLNWSTYQYEKGSIDRHILSCSTITKKAGAQTPAY